MFKLIETLVEKGEATHAELFACFISNTMKQVPTYCQKASRRTDGHVVWDYHVIALQLTNGLGQCLVWDLDSTLPFPCPLVDYQAMALPDSGDNEPVGMEGCERLYRLIPSSDFLNHFASDRSHMRRGDGSWLAPPPPWPGIRAQTDGSTNRIEQYWSMDDQDDRRLGRVTGRITFDLLQIN